MNIESRLATAVKRHPSIFPGGGVSDCCVTHGDDCTYESSGCNCVPMLTITTKIGKFDVDDCGVCRRLGIEGETIPVLFDPRRGDLN